MDHLTETTERLERLVRLETNMGHLVSGMADVRANHERLAAEVRAIDKRVIWLCALAGGGSAGAVQILFRLLGVH